MLDINRGIREFQIEDRAVSGGPCGESRTDLPHSALELDFGIESARNVIFISMKSNIGSTRSGLNLHRCMSPDRATTHEL